MSERRVALRLITSLEEQGVAHFVVAPGSRSTPLVRALIKNGSITSVHFDERGAAFFALGVALSSKKPVAIIVTSGTALGNLVPAVMESFHSEVPLILLTADRPKNLVGSGSNQTTFQEDFFGKFIHFSFDFSEENFSEKCVDAIVAEALFHAKKGPIHLNCRFEEDFYKEEEENTPLLPSQKWISTKAVLSKEDIIPIKELLVQAKRGLILVGSLKDPLEAAAIQNFAQKLGWPLVRDLLSQISGPKGIAHENPDLIIHFGGVFIDKKLNGLKAEHVIQVNESEKRLDCAHRTTIKVIAKPSIFIESLGDIKGTKSNQNIYNESLTEEEKIVKNILDHADKKQALFVGNSLAVRLVDKIYSHCFSGIFCNRGLSGIDGAIATIAGIAEGSEHGVTAIIGDITALHDINSLTLIAKSKKPIHLFILNNHGGRIFEKLNVFKYEEKENFERFWLTSQNFDFETAAKAFGVNFLQNDYTPLGSALIECTLTEPASLA